MRRCIIVSSLFRTFPESRRQVLNLNADMAHLFKSLFEPHWGYGNRTQFVRDPTTNNEKTFILSNKISASQRLYDMIFSIPNKGKTPLKHWKNVDHDFHFQKPFDCNSLSGQVKQYAH